MLVGDRETLERVEEPDKYKGYTLRDPLNQRIGVVDTLFASQFGEPQYVRVKFRSGLRRSSSLLLPVERVAVSTEYMTMFLQ
jgi:hypothetical protein